MLLFSFIDPFPKENYVHNYIIMHILSLIIIFWETKFGCDLNPRYNTNIVQYRRFLGVIKSLKMS